MTPDQLESLYASVFRNTGKDPKWLGYWIGRFIDSERLPRSELARQFGITEHALALLCLCRTPRPEHFQEDIHVVSERTGAREEDIARVIRQENVLARWRDNTSVTPAGWLLAASDREAEPESDDFPKEQDENEGKVG